MGTASRAGEDALAHIRAYTDLRSTYIRLNIGFVSRSGVVVAGEQALADFGASQARHHGRPSGPPPQGRMHLNKIDEKAQT